MRPQMMNYVKSNGATLNDATKMCHKLMQSQMVQQQIGFEENSLLSRAALL